MVFLLGLVVQVQMELQVILLHLHLSLQQVAVVHLETIKQARMEDREDLAEVPADLMEIVRVEVVMQVVIVHQKVIVVEHLEETQRHGLEEEAVVEHAALALILVQDQVCQEVMVEMLHQFLELFHNHIIQLIQVIMKAQVISSVAVAVVYQINHQVIAQAETEVAEVHNIRVLVIKVE